MDVAFNNDLIEYITQSVKMIYFFTLIFSHVLFYLHRQSVRKIEKKIYGKVRMKMYVS